MGTDAKSEVVRLLAEGEEPGRIRLDLENKGFSSDDVATALSEATRPKSDIRTSEEKHNSRLLATRDVFDRIGYGGATPQFVNVLFWLSQSTSPFVLPIIGVLNGLKTIISVMWSGILQEYSKLHRVSKNTIATAGILFGFSFLFLAFGLLLQSIWLFSLAFLVGALGVVAYGDLYNRFVRDTIRRERMGWFLRSIAHWGVIITAVTLLLAGYMLDAFPMTGTPWSFLFMGKIYHLKVYGYLLAFEITAFAFIIAGYVSSLVVDKREELKYPFWQFMKEYYAIIRSKTSIYRNKYVVLLTIAAIVSGFLQVIITAYSGIAMFQFFETRTSTPFFTLALVYAIAIIASFTGPFFTQKLHRSTGLAPMLVFGTLLLAILPLVLVYNPHIAAIAAALCMYVVGGAISGFAQGLLAQKLMNEETRRGYFQAQSFIMLIPYLVLIPLLAIGAYVFSLNTLFLIAAGGLIIIVMPIYFLLVTISQKIKL